MRWSDVIPSIAPGSATDADIVPWQMNTSSGTFATFQSYIQNNAVGVPVGWSPDGQSCDRKLSRGNVPLENDIKQLVKDPVALGTGTSADNPVNWIWWGSFGVFSAFPSDSNFTRSGTTVQAIAAPVNGILPSTSRIIANTYPIGRTLYQVTRKFDADCAKTAGVCDFVGNTGPAIPSDGHDRPGRHRRFEWSLRCDPGVHPVHLPGQCAPARGRPVHRDEPLLGDHDRHQQCRIHGGPECAAHDRIPRARCSRSTRSDSERREGLPATGGPSSASAGRFGRRTKTDARDIDKPRPSCARVSSRRSALQPSVASRRRSTTTSACTAIAQPLLNGRNADQR